MIFNQACFIREETTFEMPHNDYVVKSGAVAQNWTQVNAGGDVTPVQAVYSEVFKTLQCGVIFHAGKFCGASKGPLVVTVVSDNLPSVFLSSFEMSLQF